MSDKCEECIHELDGDGGAKPPCNLCSENDFIKMLLKHRNEFDAVLLMQLCQPLGLSISDLNKVKNHFKEYEEQ